MRKSGLFYCVSAVAVAWASCAPKQAAPAKRGPSAIAIEVSLAREASVERNIQFVGSFTGNRTVLVSSQVDGAVSRIFADVGDPVKKGDVLVQLDDKEFKLEVEKADGIYQSTLSRLGFDTRPATPIKPEETADVKRAQAQLNWATVDYNRAKSLYDQGAISQSELDKTKTAYDSAAASYDSAVDNAKSLIAMLDSQQASLDLARKHLRDTAITSPLDGVVSKRAVEAGQYISGMRGSAIVEEVVDFVPIKLQGLIPERFVPFIKSGQPVKASVDSASGRTFEGTITRITPDVNTLSRSVIIEATFANADRALKPGAFADASVVTSASDKAIVVPTKAVVAFAGLYKVFVIADGKAHARQITRGITVPPDGIEVILGVQAGEQVAITSVNSLYDGAPVTVRSPTGSAP